MQVRKLYGCTEQYNTGLCYHLIDKIEVLNL